MAENVKKLNTLRTLSIFIPGGKTGCSITELGPLKLEAELFLINLQNVRSYHDAQDARLSENPARRRCCFKSLTSLTIEAYIFWKNVESCNSEKLTAFSFNQASGF